MNSIEIFSGAGGLAKGLELAGFKHKAFVENNKHSCASLKKNFDAAKVFHLDIQNYSYANLRNIDIVAGGPPCQPFSLGGKHKANEDTRDMFPYAIQAIEALSPKAFIFENVKGLLRPTFSEYFNYVLLRLTFPDCKIKSNMTWQEHLKALKKIDFTKYDGIKYTVTYKLLNAADYGVPQCRERVFIVGIRSDSSQMWKFPEPTHSQELLLRDKIITGEYWDRHKIDPNRKKLLASDTNNNIALINNRIIKFGKIVKPWLTIRDTLCNVPHPLHKHDIPDHIFRDGARTYAGHTGSEYDWPSKTIKAGGHGVPGGENMIRFEDGSVRYLTVYEAKLIQTFPHNYYIYGAWGEAMRQIGNAVPVVLAEKLGLSLLKLLENFNKSLSNRPRAHNRA